MSLAGVHHIGILVSDLSQAEKFATEVLGLELTKRVSLAEESTEAGRLREHGVRFAAAPGRPETEEPLVAGGARSFFSVPGTSGGIVWQLIEHAVQVEEARG